MAKEEAPSILLLEDLNLYVESTSPYAPEWACLQACIDDAKDTDLFVIATTNDTRYMPPSLLRPGRFDYVIYLQPPIGENAENIVSYYLRDKDLAEDSGIRKSQIEPRVLFKVLVCFQYFDRLTLVFHIFVPREQEKGLLHWLLYPTKSP